MNKLLMKVAGIALGLSLATGIGVAVGGRQAKAVPAQAAEALAFHFAGSSLATGTTYQAWSGEVSSATSSAVSKATWQITVGNNSAQLGTNAKATNLSKATLGNGNFAAASGIASALGITTSTEKYSAAICTTAMSNILKGELIFTGTNGGNITTAWVLSSTNGTTWEIESTKTSSITTGSTFTFTKNTDSRQYAFVAYWNLTNSGGLKGFEFKLYNEPAAAYTVSFNSNGGSGNMSNVTDVSGNYTLPACTFTAPNNKTFSGWKAGNAGDLLAVGASYNVTQAVTFYAQWVDAYTVTYSAGTNGTGSYAHTLQPAGTYTLLPFADLTGVSADSGYRFANYTVGGVDKDPGDTITLSAATAVTVNFEVKPEETTYNFATNFSTYASTWTTTYGSKTLAGTTDVGGDYSATIVLGRANKQSSGTIPTLAAQKDSTFDNIIVFTLTETGKKIKDVVITFTQRGSNAPTLNLFKGSNTTATGISSIDSATIGTKSTLNATNLNDVSFSVNCVASGTSNNCSVDLASIYISVENQAAYGITHHITVASLPQTVYHVGETYDATGLVVTAYDGADEATANFKDVTASISTGFTSGVYTFDDDDVPSVDMWVQYTESGTTYSADDITMHVYALAEYELVESEPADWSGEYLIVSTDGNGDLRAMNGALTAIDVEGNHKTAIDTAGIIENGQELEFAIASYSTGYSIQGKSGKYIGWANGSANGLTASDTALVNTLSYSDGGVVIAGSGGRKLNFNTDGEGRFRYYTSGKVQLYKLVESDDASDYADMFLETLSTGASAVCQYNESTHVVSTDLDDLKQAWKDLADLYDLLSAADKEQFRLGIASGDPNATNIAKALALYDHIAAAYNTQLEGQGYVSDYDFMNRGITPANGRAMLPIVDSNETTGAIITVVSLTSVAAIGGYFFLRKRRLFK